MRNYGGFGKAGASDRKYKSIDKVTASNGATTDKDKQTKVVFDDNTIYEIDLDCYECKKKNEKKK